MLPKISNVLLGQRAEVKSLLAILLPELSPTARLELLAHHAGHRSDAAMSAHMGPDPEPRDVLSELAASGRVLPLLVYASLPGVRPASNTRASARPRAPKVGDILRAAEGMVQRDTFLECLEDPFSAALVAPDGACRWFFGVTASNIAFKPKPGCDRFWLARGCEMASGLLGLVQHAPKGSKLDEALLRHLAESTAPQTLWEQAAHRLLKEAVMAPSKTLQSVLCTVQDILGSTGGGPETGIVPCGSWK